MDKRTTFVVTLYHADKVLALWKHTRSPIIPIIEIIVHRSPGQANLSWHRLQYRLKSSPTSILPLMRAGLSSTIMLHSLVERLLLNFHSFLFSFLSSILTGVQGVFEDEAKRSKKIGGQTKNDPRVDFEAISEHVVLTRHLTRLIIKVSLPLQRVRFCV